ncbi:MAG: rhodanese-like domain-containing protein [Elusimicrobia bacterium]|nr:rhodanese-like domain-containing protein [Elusimicrobiota bacterium]
MDIQTLQPYLLPALIAGHLILRRFRANAARKKLPALAAEGAVFVDVRTPEEFAARNRPGSINIPLAEIPARAKNLDKNSPVVLCCASGARSGMAAGILKSMGFRNVTNAGPWQNTL